MSGVQIPETVQGSSLVPVIDGRSEEIYPFIVGYFRDDQRMIRTDRWKYIWYPQINREQLFDLQSDPHEMNDLAARPSHTEKLSELRQQLLGWLEQHEDPLVLTESSK